MLSKIFAFRVSESDSRFFEQFGALSQRFQERELLKVESKSETEGAEEANREVGVTATTPGLTWDSINYNNIFTFNQHLEKAEVRNIIATLPRLFARFILAGETLR